MSATLNGAFKTHESTPGATLQEQLRWQIDVLEDYPFSTGELLKLAADELDRASIAISDGMPRWIPVGEQPLPAMDHAYKRGTYLVANAKGQVAPHIRGVIHNNVGSAWDWEYGEAITHWMPLPEAPK